MKRRIVLLCIAYCLAVFCAIRIPELSTEMLGMALIIFLGIVCWRFRAKGKWTLLLVVFILLGHAHASYRNRDANFVPAQFHTHFVQAEGVVREVRTGEGYRCYILAPEKISAKRSDGILTADAKGDIAVTVYEIDEQKAPYVYGDYILVGGTFTLLDSPANTGEFDYGMWYKMDGVYASITTQEMHTRFLRKAEMPKVERFVNSIRMYCVEKIRTYIGGKEGGLLSGILLSWREDLPEEFREDIANAGLSHMCVASGMHVSMIYGILLWIFTRLRMKKWFYYPLCAIVLHFFAAMCGSGPSIQRAILMFDLCMLSFYTHGDEDRVYTCFCAGFLMLLFNPLYLFSTGFLLSFLCVFGILLFEKHFEGVLLRFLKWRPLCSGIAVSLSAQVLMLPILALYFNRIPLYGILYNMLILWVITPLMGISVVFLVLEAVWPYGAGGIAYVLNLVLQGICALIGCVRYLPASVLNVAMPSAAKMLLYYCMVGCIFCVTKHKKRYAQLCMRVALVCILCITIVSLADNHYLKLDFINVGEGDAALLRSPAGVNILIDGGGSAATSSKNVGEDTLLPYLRRNGVAEIDCAVVSHYEKDHVQGILYACEHIKVHRLILPKRHDDDKTEYRLELEACAEKNGIEVQYVCAGDCVDLGDGLRLEVLSPNEAMLQRPLGENNLSLVMRLCYGEFTALFTGDAEMLAEKQLVLAGCDVQADVYKVAHHGAKTSSAYPFVERVKPKYSVISSGDYNSSGHPALQTVRTLERTGTELYNTYEDGNVRFYITRRGVRYIQ